MRRVGLWLVLAMVWGAPGAADASGNLLVNGDAEAHVCAHDWSAQTPVPGWRVTRGAVSVLCYSAFAIARETPALPSGDPGKALFSAPGADSAMEQSVDVGAAAAAIDSGAVTFDLSGWLGGWRAMPDRAALTLTFLNADGEATGAPVEIADSGAKDRGGTTALVSRRRAGPVPKGTRRMVATVNFLQSPFSFQDAFADNLSLTLSGDNGALAAAPLAPPPAGVPALDHVIVVMMENANYADVFHTSGRTVSVDAHMPFLASLAPQGVILSNVWATYHPSDQNYVAMVAGDTFKFGPVYFPDYDLPTHHVGDMIQAKGKRWRAYVQRMGKPCNLQSSGLYSPDDEPFVHFKNVIDDAPRCARSLLPLPLFQNAVAQGDLPDFAWIAADNWWDGEGAWYANYDNAFSLARQDDFLRQTFAPLLQSEIWRNSRSLLVITWDEAEGWGWPDNRVPTLALGSPGLLRAGAVVGEHYDGYSVLRTIELALGLQSLGRFDVYAEPLNAVFAANAAPAPEEAAPADSLVTRGALAQTLGTSTVAASVLPGGPVTFVAPAGADDLTLTVAPWGSPPDPQARRHRFVNGVATATANLTPGVYAAWIAQGDRPPRRAARPFQVLAPPRVTQAAPGVEIVGAPEGGQGAYPARTRQVANMILRYCRPAAIPAANAWIGLFPKGTPAAQLTKDQANQIGNWLRAPDTDGAPCGETSAYSAALAANADYEAILFLQRGDKATPVGSRAAFRVTPALP